MGKKINGYKLCRDAVCRICTGIFIILYFLPIFFPSCASIGSPSGGDIDSIPPVFVRSKPAPNSTNFSGKKIELYFNEYISIDKPSEKVIITPPQSKMPVIRSFGKKIEVELKDSLIENTTYTFDFTNAIVDNNEKNAIEGFTFAFSTGDVIDSLIISGILLNAENLEPMPNIMVGLHSNLADSAFKTIQFIRTSMTNDRGKFWIRNVAPGTYRLFALKDLNRNYKFDQVTEEIAFFETLITPSFIPDVRMDTLRIDSVTIDTIKAVNYNRFIPDDIIMYLFKEQKDKQYLSRTERPVDRQLIFRFNSSDSLPPVVNLLDENLERKSTTDWLIPEYSIDKKNITYWITDSLIFQRDTIRVEAIYHFTDSANILVQKTDTISFPWKKPRETAKKDNKNAPKIRADLLRIEFSARSVMDVNDTLKITFPEPVIDFDFNKIRIQQKADTIWEDRQFPIVRDTLNPRLFYVDKKWFYEHEYRISIDSASVYSIYGNWNDSIGTSFKFYSEKEYGVQYVNISGNDGPGFGELLDASDKVVRKSILKDGELVFEDLKPGKYYLRFIEDTNENGKWDTGNYEEKLQPEKVYYYKDVLTVAKWGEDVKDWDIKEIPVDKQKPLEITKNKPAVKQQRRNDQTNKNKQQNTGGSNPFGGGRSMPGLGGRPIPGM